MKKIITKFIAFVSFLLISMESFNKIFLYLAKKNNKVLPLVNKTYCWKYGNIKYYEKGTGAPLLLIHDMSPGSSSLEWKKTITFFSQNYHIYVIDLPGFGISDKNIKTYTNYLYITFIRDFISDIIREKTTVVTSGEAANIGILAASEYCNLFDKLILVNPASINKYNCIPDKNSKLIKRIISFPIIGSFIYLISLFMQKNLSDEYLFAAQYDGENARHYYGSYICNYINFPVCHKIENISIPMLLITTEKYENLHHISADFDKYIDNCHTIKNASTFPHIENSEAFFEAFNTLTQYNYDDV